MFKKSKNIKATANIDDALSASGNMILIYVATPLSGDDKYYDHTGLSKVLMQHRQNLWTT